MGEVIPFRRARLTGFIPDDLGDPWAEKHKPVRDDKASLVEFAKRGSPPDPDCA